MSAGCGQVLLKYLLVEEGGRSGGQRGRSHYREVRVQCAPRLGPSLLALKTEELNGKECGLLTGPESGFLGALCLWGAGTVCMTAQETQAAPLLAYICIESHLVPLPFLGHLPHVFAVLIYQ